MQRYRLILAISTQQLFLVPLPLWLLCARVISILVFREILLVLSSRHLDRFVPFLFLGGVIYGEASGDAAEKVTWGRPGRGLKCQFTAIWADGSLVHTDLAETQRLQQSLCGRYSVAAR